MGIGMSRLGAPDQQIVAAPLKGAGFCELWLCSPWKNALGDYGSMAPGYLVGLAQLTKHRFC